MKNESNQSISGQPVSDQKAWLIIGMVFLSLVFVLGIVYMREREKPHSPHALVAAAFAQRSAIGNWQSGGGVKPFTYYPPAENTLVWQPLPDRSVPSTNYTLVAGG